MYSVAPASKRRFLIFLQSNRSAKLYKNAEKATTIKSESANNEARRRLWYKQEHTQTQAQGRKNAENNARTTRVSLMGLFTYIHTHTTSNNVFFYNQ